MDSTLPLTRAWLRRHRKKETAAIYPLYSFCTVEGYAVPKGASSPKISQTTASTSTGPAYLPDQLATCDRPKRHGSSTKHSHPTVSITSRHHQTNKQTNIHTYIHPSSPNPHYQPPTLRILAISWFTWRL